MNPDNRSIAIATAPTQYELPGETVRLRNREFLIRCLLTHIGSARLKAHFLSLAIWAVTYENVNDAGLLYARREKLMASLGHTRVQTFTTQNNALEALKRIERTNNGRGCGFRITPTTGDLKPPLTGGPAGLHEPATETSEIIRDRIAQTVLTTECETWHQKTHLAAMAAGIIGYGNEDGTLTIDRNELARVLEHSRVAILNEKNQELVAVGKLKATKNRHDGDYAFRITALPKTSPVSREPIAISDPTDSAETVEPASIERASEQQLKKYCVVLRSTGTDPTEKMEQEFRALPVRDAWERIAELIESSGTRKPKAKRNVPRAPESEPETDPKPQDSDWLEDEISQNVRAIGYKELESGRVVKVKKTKRHKPK